MINFDILFFSYLSFELASAKYGTFGHNFLPSSKFIKNSANFE
jgi:hypothetical protein